MIYFSTIIITNSPYIYRNCIPIFYVKEKSPMFHNVYIYICWQNYDFTIIFILDVLNLTFDIPCRHLHTSNLGLYSNLLSYRIPDKLIPEILLIVLTLNMCCVLCSVIWDTFVRGSRSFCWYWWSSWSLLFTVHGQTFFIAIFLSSPTDLHIPETRKFP